jgi:hypothetical protein
MAKKRNPWKDALYGTHKGPKGNPDQWRAAFGEAWDQATCKTIIKEQSPWDILGVKVGATWAEIRQAYHSLIRKWHPDVNKAPEATEECRKIIAAYTLLEETQAPGKH